MQVLYNPQHNSHDKSVFSFEEDIVTISINGDSEVYDFTNLPDGAATEIKSSLPHCLISSAERKDGKLYIQLTYYTTQEELNSIPIGWQEV